MKKRLVTTITVLCLLCGFFVPVQVHAESSTYVIFDANTCYLAFKDPYGTYSPYYSVQTNNSVRVVMLHYGNNAALYVVSEEPFNLNLTSTSNSNGSCNVPTNSANSRTYNGKTYYYSSSTRTNFNANYNNGNAVIYSDIPYIESNALNVESGIYYTFGDGAIDPAPPAPTYTRPANVAYSTRIAGSGMAAANNIDRITWNADVDTNGTVLPANARVQIRAIPGQYTGTTKEDLLTKTYTDFVIDNTKAVQLVDILASRGVYETKWSEVIEHFNIPFMTFNSLIQGDSYWYRNGWIYQIRLQVDDYYSDWTNIYTATGSGVSEAETISNSDNITQELIQQIQIINNLNETTTNWYVSNTEINMQPYEEPAEGEKPWWAYLLEAIVKAFGDILGFLGNLIGDLMDAITDLFKPAEFTINEYNDFKVEIKQNSGLFGQAIDFTNDLKNTFMGVQYQEPILHWQGISFDGIVFLPAADYNLNEYVTMWGLGDFRQIAYICSDGFIFFSLLLLIIRKLNEVLKK